MIDNYNINLLVQEVLKLDYIDIIELLNKKIKCVDIQSNRVSEDEKYSKNKYFQFIKELLYKLNTGIDPFTTEECNKRYIDTIIEELKKKGQWEE